MLEAIRRALPGLEAALDGLRWLHDDDALWQALRRLLLAPAPSGGAALPGGILDEITSLTGELELFDRLMPHLGSTGNAGLWLGADDRSADLVVIAHMDRPTFRVRDVHTGELYPMCATRFPADPYTAPARALRFEDRRLVVGAWGTLTAAGQTLRLRVERGHLRWYDCVVLDAEPEWTGPEIVGTGLDNCLGVTALLGAAAALSRVDADLRRLGRRCLFVFSDLEEGVPTAFFGHGAARLTHLLPPPALGCVVVDAQTAQPDGVPALGAGASHGTVSAWSRGSAVPPNLIALALDLADEANGAHRRLVQMNTSYLSRSDDMALGRWAPVLAMIGPPMTDPHTDQERARLPDVQAAIRWLALFIGALLTPDIQRQYALMR